MSPLSIFASVDADQYNYKETRKSRFGCFIAVSGFLIVKRLRRQCSIALSSAESEYVFLLSCVYAQTVLGDIDQLRRLSRTSARLMVYIWSLPVSLWNAPLLKRLQITCKAQVINLHFPPWLLYWRIRTLMNTLQTTYKIPWILQDEALQQDYPTWAVSMRLSAGYPQHLTPSVWKWL